MTFIDKLQGISAGFFVVAMTYWVHQLVDGESKGR